VTLQEYLAEHGVEAKARALKRNGEHGVSMPEGENAQAKGPRPRMISTEEAAHMQANDLREQDEKHDKKAPDQSDQEKQDEVIVMYQADYIALQEKVAQTMGVFSPFDANSHSQRAEVLVAMAKDRHNQGGTAQKTLTMNELIAHIVQELHESDSELQQMEQKYIDKMSALMKRKGQESDESRRKRAKKLIINSQPSGEASAMAESMQVSNIVSRKVITELLAANPNLDTNIWDALREQFIDNTPLAEADYQELHDKFLQQREEREKVKEWAEKRQSRKTKR